MSVPPPDTARERFAQAARGSDADIDLARAALWIAAESQPGLDVDRYLKALDELAEAARPLVQARETAGDAARELLRFLCSDRGFTGNRQDYYDPRNSMLNEVIDRRTGIPITLSLVVIEVARRAGLDLRGVSFPGHFLVRTADESPTLLDPFEGRTLERADCAQLLRQVQGADAALRAEHLRPARPHEILVRVLTNLKQIYLQRQELELALACCDRILILVPDAPFELRDRGLIYAQLECFQPALADLERFVELAASPAVDRAAHDMIESLRQRAQRIH